MSYTYSLGAVKPWVSDVAKRVGPAFNVANIGGWRASAGDMTGHPAGLALDLQVGQDKAKGDRIAAYFVGNAGPLKVKYVMWQQRWWRPGKGWQPVAFKAGDRPGYDPNHLRHVHVSFLEEVSDGRRLPGPESESEGLPWWVPPPLRFADWVSKQLGDKIGEVVDGIGDGVEDAVGTITSPLDAVRTLMSSETWMRVGQVVGGGGLVVLGVIVLIVSSLDSDKAGAALAAIPHPAAKAAGAASALAD